MDWQMSRPGFNRVKAQRNPLRALAEFRRERKKGLLYRQYVAMER